MQNAEKAGLDPLETINRYYKQDVDREKPVLGKVGGAILVSNLAAFPIGNPELIAAVGLIDIVAGGYYCAAKVIKAYRWVAGGKVGKKELQEAQEQIINSGETLRENHSLDELGRHLLATRIRGTKLYLAEHGILDRYEEFNWLKTIPISPYLKPTKTELDEVDRWEEAENRHMASFIEGMSKRKGLVVECGTGILPESTKVYILEKDEKDSFRYDSVPLLDLLTTLKAGQKELKTIGLDNTISYLQGQKNHDGIFSYKGRQILADFFGKEIVFYVGAEQAEIYITPYGFKEKATITLNSFPELLLRANLGRMEPCDIQNILPTADRLTKLGLIPVTV